MDRDWSARGECPGGIVASTLRCMLGACVLQSNLTEHTCLDGEEVVMRAY